MGTLAITLLMFMLMLIVGLLYLLRVILDLYFDFDYYEMFKKGLKNVHTKKQ